MTLVEGLRRLVEEAELYLDPLKAVGSVRVAVALTNSDEEATLVFQDGVEIVAGVDEADLLIEMELSTFERILRGEADFGALIARSRVTDIRPIGFKVLNPEKVDIALEALKAVGMFLFTPGRIKMKKLRLDLAGEAHGGHPIPLLYWDGVRVAWYMVRRGEILNPEGERDPYPQLLIVLKGRGLLRLEGESMAVEPGEAVYVPPNSLHQLRAEEDLELLWIAWQAP